VEFHLDHRVDVTRGHDRVVEAAILIIGSSHSEAFAPAEILICADTLSAEVGIWVWLEAHGIRATG
jgi:hypothetical protein